MQQKYTILRKLIKLVLKRSIKPLGIVSRNFTSRNERDYNTIFDMITKEKTNEEQKLIGEIEQLDSQENDNLTALTERKEKLKYLYNQKLNGVLVRSRANWLKNGEKTSKYLCSLEQKKNMLKKQ